MVVLTGAFVNLIIQRNRASQRGVSTDRVCRVEELSFCHLARQHVGAQKVTSGDSQTLVVPLGADTAQQAPM